MEEQIRGILSLWGMADAEVHQIYDSAWQIGTEYVLKAYDSHSSMERNIKILSILDDMHIPVGKIVRTAEGKNFAENGLYCFLMEIVKSLLTGGRRWQ